MSSLLEEKAITISRRTVKEELEHHLNQAKKGRKPTEKEIQEFIEYLEVDIGQWLTDNAKSFIRDVLIAENRL